MPALDSAIIALLATVANIVTQLVKELVPDTAKQWIPLGLVLLTMGVGIGLAAIYGRDLVAGLLEGLFGGASAVGVYEVGSNLPGVSRVYNGDGWIQPKSPDSGK
jgi:uncharacterized membrane protein